MRALGPATCMSLLSEFDCIMRFTYFEVAHFFQQIVEMMSDEFQKWFGDARQ